jgi:hypothetical protein
MLFREYDAAQEGARHNFASRSQYLGFFFTILFAGVAYLGSLARDGQLSRPWPAVTASALLWIITLLSILTFISVAKLGRVMSHQAHVTGRIREHFLGASELELLKAKDVKVGKDEAYPHPLFTVQRSAEATFELGAVLAIAAQLALAVRFTVRDADPGVRALLWALAGSSFGAALVVWLRRRDVLILAAEIDPRHPGPSRRRR